MLARDNAEGASEYLSQRPTGVSLTGLLVVMHPTFTFFATEVGVAAYLVVGLSHLSVAVAVVVVVYLSLKKPTHDYFIINGDI